MVFRQFKSALLISAIAHLVIFTAGLLWLEPNISHPPRTTPETIPVEWLAEGPNKRNVTKLHRKPPPRANFQKPHTRNTPQLKDLGLSLHSTLQKSGVTPKAATTTSATAPSESMSNGIDLAQESHQSKLHWFIYDTIETHLTYPTELKEHKIAGIVSAAIAFDEKGEFLEDRTQIKSTSSYLRVLVARALRSAFSEPIPPSKLFDPKPFTIDSQFQFEIIANDDAHTAASKKSYLSNVFFFYRHHPRSVAQWKIGPVEGIGPLPSLNLLWFPKAINEALSNKAKIDPLESYREDPWW